MHLSKAQDYMDSMLWEQEAASSSLATPTRIVTWRSYQGSPCFFIEKTSQLIQYPYWFHFYQLKKPACGKHKCYTEVHSVK